jgi:hypothetical protein
MSTEFPVPYVQDLLEKGYIHSFDLDSVWLRNRVTDIWLCVYGGAEWLNPRKRSATPPAFIGEKLTYTVKVGDTTVSECERWTKAEHIARCLSAAGAKGITIYGPADAWSAKQPKGHPLYAEIGTMRFWPFSIPGKKLIPELKPAGRKLMADAKLS